MEITTEDAAILVGFLGGELERLRLGRLHEDVLDRIAPFVPPFDLQAAPVSPANRVELYLSTLIFVLRERSATNLPAIVEDLRHSVRGEFSDVTVAFGPDIVMGALAEEQRLLEGLVDYSALIAGLLRVMEQLELRFQEPPLQDGDFIKDPPRK